MISRRQKFSRPWPIGSLAHLGKKIWLNPDYQREEVWGRPQKQLLVDSLLRDMDLPKFYFREINKRGYQYEVVDGQQRLRSIFDFIKNKFQLSEFAANINKYSIAGQSYKDLHIDLQQELLGKSIDVVHLVGYSDDDIEEMFLRLQNGTPLNAPEKRRAVGGNVRTVVERLSKHKIFKQCAFTNRRFAHEDAAAKILHLVLSGRITDIKPSSIKKTYEINKTMTENDTRIKRLIRTFNFIDSAFRKQKRTAGFKKFSLITTTFLIYELLEDYDLSLHEKEFAKIYLDFELGRKENEERPESKQDSVLAAYTDAARSDSIPDMEFRDKILRRSIIMGIPKLTLKDVARGFTSEQRSAVFWRDKGKCCKCGKKCEETEFEVDHIKAHSRGGKTCLSNAQLLCITCNRKKGAR